MTHKKPVTVAMTVAVVVAAVALIIAAVDSLSWRYQHDSPLMIYAGFLVANGAVPYRDFFDMNTPGVYFIMAAVGLLGGWSDFPFRVFDLICLTIISISTFLWMRRFGTLSAFAGAIMFPTIYLNWGPPMSLQREFIALTPFAIALAIILSPTDTQPMPAWRTFLIGILIGISSLLKPQFLLLSIPIPILLLTIKTSHQIPLVKSLIYLTGLLLPIFAALIYLLASGGLRYFIDIAVGYWPLYTSMTGDHRPIAGLSRLLYLVGQTANGASTFWLPLSAVSLVAVAKAHNWRAWFIGSLIALSILYPGISGQFWLYHWLPMYYLTSSMAPLSVRLLQQLEGQINGAGKAAFMCVVVASMLLPSSIALTSVLSKANHYSPKAGVPDEIAAFLSSHMKPGDTVQPLDWTGGAVHGMLMTKAPLATRFMYDFHFYHHITHPYILNLRQEFISEIKVRKPSFVIQIIQNKPWPRGPNTTREFPELKAFLEEHYVPVQENVRYRIFRRKD